jgi:hypothetical protein
VSRGLVEALVVLVIGCGTPQGIADAPVRDAPEADAAMVDAARPDASVDDGPPGIPDLQLVPEQMTHWLVEGLSFDAAACEVVEGCVDAPGPRVVLRFDTVAANRGTADVVIGRTPDAGVSDATFQWSACHKHHHYANFTTYELVNDTGTVLTARKQAFCLEDDEPVELGAQSSGYVCTNQGISRGWADVYTRGTACQWIDVTDLPHGAYTLRVTLNPLHTITESDYENNVFTLDVQF